MLAAIRINTCGNKQSTVQSLPHTLSSSREKKGIHITLVEAVRSKPFLLDTLILVVIATLCLKTYTKIHKSFAFSVNVCIEVTCMLGLCNHRIKEDKRMQDCWDTVEHYVYLKWKQHVYIIYIIELTYNRQWVCTYSINVYSTHTNWLSSIQSIKWCPCIEHGDHVQAPLSSLPLPSSICINEDWIMWSRMRTG